MAKNSRFQYKLWNIVNTCQSGAIKWSKTGDSIIINFDKFKKEYLDPNDNFCKSKNLNSLIRQLNLYGFRKMLDLTGSSAKGEEKEYSNSDFKRDRPDLLLRIVRCKTEQSYGKVKQVKKESFTDDENDETFKPRKKKSTETSSKRKYHKKLLAKNWNSENISPSPKIKRGRGRPRKVVERRLPLSDLAQKYQQDTHFATPVQKINEDMFTTHAELARLPHRSSTCATQKKVPAPPGFYNNKIFPETDPPVVSSSYESSKLPTFKSSFTFRKPYNFTNTYASNYRSVAQNTSRSFHEVAIVDNSSLNKKKFVGKKITCTPTDIPYPYLTNNGTNTVGVDCILNPENTQSCGMNERNVYSGVQHLSNGADNSHDLQQIQISDVHSMAQNWIPSNPALYSRQRCSNKANIFHLQPDVNKPQISNKHSSQENGTENTFRHVIKIEPEDEGWPGKSNLTYSALADEFDKENSIFKYSYAPNIMMTYGFYGMTERERNIKNCSFMDSYGRYMYTGN